MAEALNTGFTINAPEPVDSRMQVATYSGLAAIAIKYIGLKCYVIDEDVEYRYYATGWDAWSSAPVVSIAWGDITGTLADQTDLITALNLKFNKTGGTITGEVSVTANVNAYNFILTGSEPSAGTLSIPDAPAVIGEQYARENNAWTLIVPYVPPATTDPTGLEYIAGLGWTLIDRVQANYAAVGVGAVDLSTSNSVQPNGAYGAYSVAGGFETKAGSYGAAFGEGSSAYTHGFSAGYFADASAIKSVALNDRTIASGNASLASGNYTVAKSFAETVVGMCNVDYTPTSLVAWSSTDRAFTVGIGVNTGARKDGFLVFKSGLVTAPNQTNALIDTDDQAFVTKKYHTDNPATVGIFSAYEVSILESPTNSSNTTVFHTLGDTPLFWTAYLECKTQTELGGRGYLVGARLSVPAQHESENNDLRGMQIEANANFYQVTITTIKAFGTSFSSGTNGYNIDLSKWRLKIVGVV